MAFMIENNLIISSWSSLLIEQMLASHVISSRAKLHKVSAFILPFVAHSPTTLTNKKVSEYNQQIPQSQTAEKPNPQHREEEPHNNHETPERQTKQSNQLSLPHQDDCKTRMDIK